MSYESEKAKMDREVEQQRNWQRGERVWGKGYNIREEWDKFTLDNSHWFSKLSSELENERVTLHHKIQLLKNRGYSMEAVQKIEQEMNAFIQKFKTQIK